jgi:transcription elongation factor SPT6
MADFLDRQAELGSEGSDDEAPIRRNGRDGEDSSEEESDDEEAERAVREGFIVDDDEEGGDDEDREERKRRKRRRVREEEEELDADDMDVIYGEGIADADAGQVS